MVHEDFTGCDVGPPNPFSFPFDFLTRAEKRADDEQDLGMSVHMEADRQRSADSAFPESRFQAPS